MLSRIRRSSGFAPGRGRHALSLPVSAGGLTAQAQRRRCALRTWARRPLEFLGVARCGTWPPSRLPLGHRDCSVRAPPAPRAQRDVPLVVNENGRESLLLSNRQTLPPGQAPAHCLVVEVFVFSLCRFCCCSCASQRTGPILLYFHLFVWSFSNMCLWVSPRACAPGATESRA